MLAKPHEDLVNVGTEISANDETYEINPAFKPIIESKILDIEGTPLPPPLISKFFAVDKHVYPAT